MSPLSVLSGFALVSSLSLLPESLSVSILSEQLDSRSLSDQSPTSVETTLVSGGHTATTPMSLRLVSGHQSTQTCKGCQHKVALLMLKRVTKMLQGRLSTKKTTVSDHVKCECKK